MAMISSVYLWQLVYQVPMLLLYFAGVVLALVFWRRCPVPCLLTLLAMGLLLVLAVGQFCLNYYILSGFRSSSSGSMASYVNMVAAIGIASGILHLVALGLLLAAVFVGRRGVGVPSQGFEVPV